MQYSNFEFSLKFLWFFPKIQFQNLISSQYQSFCIEIFSKCNICSCTIIIFWNGNVKCNFSNNKLCLLLFAQRCQASTPPTVKFQITTKLCRCQDVTFKIAEKIRISHIQLRSKRVIIFFKLNFYFSRKYDGISSDKLMSYEMIARFIEEKEQNKLDRRDPKILEQKRNGLLPNSDIKTMVNLKYFLQNFRWKITNLFWGNMLDLWKQLKEKLKIIQFFSANFDWKLSWECFKLLAKNQTLLPIKQKCFVR